MTGEPRHRRITPDELINVVDLIVQDAIERKEMSSDPFATEKVETNEEFSFDMSDVPDSNVIPAQDYPARLKDVQKKVSQNSGNPMMVFEYEIMGSDHKGFTMLEHCVIKPDAMWKLNQNLKALGLRNEDKKSNFTKQEAVGRKVVLQVEDGEYQGEARSQIKRVKPHPDGPEPVPETRAPGEPDF